MREKECHEHCTIFMIQNHFALHCWIQSLHLLHFRAKFVSQPTSRRDGEGKYIT